MTDEFGTLTRHVLFDALCLAAATAEQALQFACRTSPLWASSSVRWSCEGELFWIDLALSPVALCSVTPADCDELLAPWLSIAERVAQALVSPRVLCLPWLSDEAARELRRRFSCELRFGEPSLRVAFRRNELRGANPAADEDLAGVLLRCAEERLGIRTQRWGTANRVRQQLALLADPGSVSAENVAAQLGISVRTLHRRLHSEQTSYRRILKELRLDQCRAHLSVSARSAKEVAFTLGFGSAASFHRAFRRWMGCTVGEYRRKEIEGTTREVRVALPLER